MRRDEFVEKVSSYASTGQPFLFLVDFEKKQPFVCLLPELAAHKIYFDFKGSSNLNYNIKKRDVQLHPEPIQRDVFDARFTKVIKHLNDGDTYLLNLTFPTEIKVNISLSDIFKTAVAPYKLLYKDEFVVFSPERFIKISDDRIHTYPMKGTIDATINGAREKLLQDQKEIWEHNTIVDLMRNDLSIIATDVEVHRYRYIDHIKTFSSEILQTSSEIVGNMPHDWRSSLGESLMKLLPAGSISGAPKKKTVEIINDAELGARGYFTGVFGIYDGQNLDSAVAIRFIEREGEKFYFRSGGGITAKSTMDSEYQEMIQKVYVPTI